ncbi:MAG TPA: hypothetical protein IAC31_06610 [Candidatus Faecousia intestinigallinarum]|nr:hypothetical protein [Candidatus Faecousia intestinigallinarum]
MKKKISDFTAVMDIVMIVLMAACLILTIVQGSVSVLSHVLSILTCILMTCNASFYRRKLFEMEDRDKKA